MPPWRPFASWKRFFEPSLRLWCRCPEQPGYCALHFAMKLGMMPKRAPISFAPVLKRIARSAASSASEKRIAAS